jgi:CubicO group peptidase (beta-lactamase class C family)
MNKKEVNPTRRILLFLWLSILASLQFLAGQEHLQPDLTNLENVASGIMRDWHVPGLALAVVHDGKVLFAGGFGLRSINQNLKVTPLTLFPIASCTKTFTAVSAALLVGEGKLDWDSPVRDYAPAIRFYDDYAGTHVTMRDLLAHRSGLPQHYRMYYGRRLTRLEIIERLRFLEPSAGFREVFQYSNLNYVIAAYVLEERTKTAWEKLVQERIFRPLEMNSSNLSVVESQKGPDFAHPYREENDKVKQTSFFDPNTMGMGPAGSINSNALDMANWLLFHLNKGKYKDRQIISEPALTETHVPQMIMPGGMTDEMSYASYGMGWGITSYRGHLMLGHGGGFDGFSCYVSILPRDNVGCAIFCNLEGSPVPQILMKIVCDRLLGLSEIPWNERTKSRNLNAKASPQRKEEPSYPETQLCRPLGDYCGEFEHPAYGVLAVKKEHDQLVVIHNGLTAPLVHLFYDIFETKDDAFGTYRISFILNDQGAIGGVEVPFEPAAPKIIFNRIVDNP